MKHYGIATLPVNSVLLCSILRQLVLHALVWPSSLPFYTIGFFLFFLNVSPAEIAGLVLINREELQLGPKQKETKAVQPTEDYFSPFSGAPLMDPTADHQSAVADGCERCPVPRRPDF